MSRNPGTILRKNPLSSQRFPGGRWCEGQPGQPLCSKRKAAWYSHLIALCVCVCETETQPPMDAGHHVSHDVTEK